MDSCPTIDVPILNMLFRPWAAAQAPFGNEDEIDVSQGLNDTGRYHFAAQRISDSR